LSIGEFAAATQLSPKALRLYDEQRLLQPARIDPASGYRYYGHEQVTVGRLIRTLRDMDLSLAEIAAVIARSGVAAEQRLSHLASELDHRYSRQKRAFQSALLHLRSAERSEAMPVSERSRRAMTVIVAPFLASRGRFYERLRSQATGMREAAAHSGLVAQQEWHCRLLEPLSEDESQLELLIPVATPPVLPDAVTLRQMPAARCACVAVSRVDVGGGDPSACVDVLFDWFDRHGYQAIDVPFLSRGTPEDENKVLVSWSYARVER
jgi:DNA-binding transcriptional MerR regulator